MLKGIIEIGKILNSNSSNVLENKIKVGNYKAIVGIDFKLNEKKVEFFIYKISPNEEFLEKEILTKVLWVGNARGNVPQKRFTSDKISNLVKSLRNIEEDLNKSNILLQNYNSDIFLEKFGEEEMEKINLKIILSKILEEFFEEKTFLNLDLVYFDKITSNFVQTNEIKNVLAGKKNSEKEFYNEFEKLLNKMLGFKSKEKYLYTIFVNGILLSKNEEYKKILEKELMGKGEELFTTYGFCHSCGKEGKLTNNYTNLKLKFFITDKINFASGIKEEGFSLNYTICSNCYNNFSVGETFVWNNLKTRISGIDCFLIPEFLEYGNIDYFPKIIEESSQNFVSAVKSLSDLEYYRDKKEELKADLEKNDILINFVFAKISNSAVKILLLVQDVEPSWIKVLLDELLNVNNEHSHLMGEHNYKFSFYTIKSLIDNNALVLNIYKQLLGKSKIRFSNIISNIILNGKKIYLNKNESQFVNHIFYSNLFIILLRRLNLYEENKGGDFVSVDFLENLDVAEEMKNYIEKLGFDEQKTSLFLLGVLMASIGSEQYKIAKKKVILEKINFGGMPIQKVKSFSTQIFEKLNQYKLLDYNEKIFAAAKELLDNNEKNWILNPAENVYYILSGYAWKTKMILNKTNSEDKEGKLHGRNLFEEL